MPRNTIFILALLTLLLSSSSAMAEPGDILFEADETIIDSQKQYALYSGNVRITQDGATLTAETVRFNYATEKGDTETTTLTTVVAKGGVHLVYDDKTATADEAVYNAKSQSITLTGDEKPATVTSPQGTTSAGSFTIDRVSGKVIAHKSDRHRVKSTFKPGADGFSMPGSKP